MSHCHEFDEIFRTIYTVIILIFIIFTAIFSLLTIFTVVYVKKLHTSQNLIILFISVIDFLTALLLMPSKILRITDFTLCELIFTSHGCIVSDMIHAFIESIHDHFVFYIVVDKIIHIHFPIFYHNKVDNKKTCGVLTVIVIKEVILSLIAYAPNFSSMSCHFTPVSWFYKVGLFETSIFTVLSTIFFVDVCTILRRRKMKDMKSRATESLRAVNWLAFVFIITHLPRMVYNFSMLSRSPDIMTFEILVLVQYLVSATCGLVLALTRTVYKRCFKFFLTRRPCKWKMIAKKSEAPGRSITLMHHFITKLNKDLELIAVTTGRDKGQSSASDVTEFDMSDITASQKQDDDISNMTPKSSSKQFSSKQISSRSTRSPK